jgi:hypothetical protein
VGSNANYTEYHVQLFNTRTRKPIDDDSGLCNVLTASDPTEITIYSDSNGTSASNPITITNGEILFYTAASVTSVDLSILTAAGQAVFVEALTPSQHRVDIDPDATRMNTLIVPYQMASGCDVLVDTGFDILTVMKIKDVYVHSTTASTANGLYIGVSGTTAGFLANVSTTATGFKLHGSPIYTNATGSANYISGTQIRGSLLSEWTYGLSTATVGGAKGYWSRKSYLPTGATSLVYQVLATNSGGTGEGYIYIEYELAPTAGN